MKKWILILLVCLLLVGAALADDVQSAMRGNTLILRMPDSWVQAKMQDAQPHVGWWADDGQNWKWYSPASEGMLSQFARGGTAPDSGSAVLPACMIGRGFEMNLARLDGDWYSVLRLANNSLEEVLYELCNVDYNLSGEGVLSAKEKSCVSVHIPLQPLDMNGMQPDFTGAYGNVKISLFSALDASIAVITEANADADLLEEVQLQVGGKYATQMKGYMDGKTAIYCCMLDDRMATDLRKGAQASLYRPPFTQGADFEGTAYAIARKGTGDDGVIDTAGNWVVQPEYDSISRLDPERNKWDTPRPFFCCKDDDLTVLHGETLQVIAKLDGESENESNPAVFATYFDGGTRVYSALTGERLFSTDGKFFSSGDEPPQSYVQARYCALVEGYPECLVIQRGAGGSGHETSYLADNYGKRIAGDYQLIAPLMWADGQGVFLTQEDAEYGLDWSAMEFIEDFEYTRPEGFNGAWRCGLIDENGNTIAECKYTGIRILSREEIQLRDAKGKWKSFTWME